MEGEAPAEQGMCLDYNTRSQAHPLLGKSSPSIEHSVKRGFR